MKTYGNTQHAKLRATNFKNHSYVYAQVSLTAQAAMQLSRKQLKQTSTMLDWHNVQVKNVAMKTSVKGIERSFLKEEFPTFKYLQTNGKELKPAVGELPSGICHKLTWATLIAGVARNVLQLSLRLIPNSIGISGIRFVGWNALIICRHGLILSSWISVTAFVGWNSTNRNWPIPSSIHVNRISIGRWSVSDALWPSAEINPIDMHSTSDAERHENDESRERQSERDDWTEKKGKTSHEKLMRKKR